MKKQLIRPLRSLQSKQYAICEPQNKSFLSSFMGKLGDLKIRAYPFKSTFWRPCWWWANKNAGGKTPEGHQRLETKHYVVFLTNVCKENTYINFSLGFHKPHEHFNVPNKRDRYVSPFTKNYRFWYQIRWNDRSNIKINYLIIFEVELSLLFLLHPN